MAKPSKHLKIEHHEVRMDALVRHYADGFDNPKPTLDKWFFDAATGTVILRLYVEEKS